MPTLKGQSQAPGPPAFLFVLVVPLPLGQPPSEIIAKGRRFGLLPNRRQANLGASVHKRRPRARFGRTGPVRPTIFAQDAANEQQDRKDDFLNWRGRNRDELRVAMTPEHMCEIEDRWPTIRTRIQNSEHCLEVAIQVHGWNCMAAKLEQIVARVPPSMQNTFTEDYTSAGRYDDFLRSDLSAECSRFYDALFVFMEMHVQRRSACSWRQCAIQGKDDLPLRVAHAAYQQNLPGMAVFQLQIVVHELPLVANLTNRSASLHRLFAIAIRQVVSSGFPTIRRCPKYSSGASISMTCAIGLAG
jgi:hypothetical protein